MDIEPAIILLEKIDDICNEIAELDQEIGYLPEREERMNELTQSLPGLLKELDETRIPIKLSMSIHKRLLNCRKTLKGLGRGKLATKFDPFLGS